MSSAEEVVVHTNVIKRNGQEVSFDISKIINAIRKANVEVDEIYRMNDAQIAAVADNIARKVAVSPRIKAHAAPVRFVFRYSIIPDRKHRILMINIFR